MKQEKLKTTTIFYICLGIVFLLNLLQAHFMEITGDEAYYVMYSRQLDWGYFDHPPLVAIWIYLGQWLEGSLGARFGGSVSFIGMVYILYQSLELKGRKALYLFWALMGSFAMFSIYGFVITPDVPLLFFASLFIYIAKRYLVDYEWKYALLLGVVMAALLYSKYHGIIWIGLFVLANLQLLKKPSFYIGSLLGVAFFLPHLYWQYNHDFPSVAYHLSGHSADSWQWKFVWEYIPHQFLVFGVLTAIPVFIAMVKYRAVDKFERSLQFWFWGVLAFFFLMSFKSHIEPHWTVLAALPALLITTKYYNQIKQPWVLRLAIVNTGLFLVVRLLVTAQFVTIPHVHGGKEWTSQIEEISQGQPVVFYNSYQNASIFSFYTSVKTNAYGAFYYHATQYNLWQRSQELAGENILFVSRDNIGDKDFIDTPRGRYYYYWIYDYASLEDMRFSILDEQSQPNKIKVEIHNPYDFSVALNNQQHILDFYFIIKQGEKEHFHKALFTESYNILPRSNQYISFDISWDIEGEYDLLLFLASKHHPLGWGTAWKEQVNF